MKKFLFKYWEIILILLLSLSPFLWLKEGEIILGHDSGFRLNPFQHLFNLFYSWNSISNFGVDWSLYKGFLVTQFPEAIFRTWTGSLASGETLTFSFWFFLIGISMYTLVNSLFPEKKYWIFRLSSAIFYMYNFFLLQGWFIAERAKFSIFAVLPLGFLIIYKTLTRYYSPLKGFIFFSLITFFLNGGGNPSFYGALVVIYFWEFFYLTSINCLQNGLREFFYALKIGIFFFIGFLLINAYWLFSQLYLFFNKYSSSLSSSGGIEGIISWESVVNEHASFINLFRLQGIPDWYNNLAHTYANNFLNNPFLIFLSFIPVLIIILGFLFHKRFPLETRNDKLLYLFFGLYLIGLMFSAGSHPPLGFLYLFLVQNIPGFVLFRSAFYKFGPILWFSSVFLTGYFINLFIIKLLKNRTLINLVGFVPIIFILLYHYPYFNGSFFDWNKPFSTKVHLPEYVQDASNYINLSTPDNLRILLLPQLDPSFHADSYTWGFFSLDLLPRLLINRSVIANDNNAPVIISNIYEAINQNDQLSFLRLAGLAGINKVLWRDDVLYSDKATQSKNLSAEEIYLSRFAGVSLEKQFDKWKIYNVDSSYFLPLVYIPESIIYSQSQESLLGDILGNDVNASNPLVLFDNALLNKNQSLESFAKEIIIEATCIMCEPDELKRKEQAVYIPSARLLPDSPFYSLIFFREQREFEAYKNNPLQIIDYDLGLANRRLAEMKQMIERNSKDKPKELISELFAKYKSLINDALKMSSQLPDDSRNMMLVKTLYYLQGQYRFLSLIEDKQNIAEDDLDDLAIFMQDLIVDLSNNQVWMSTVSRDQFRYTFNLKNEGTYDLYLKETEENQPLKIAVDNKELTGLKNNFFSAGIHKLNLTYSPPANLLEFGEGTSSGRLDLTVGKTVKLPIRNLSDQNTYLISFNYKIIEGRPGLAIIGEEEVGSVKKIRLEQNSLWNAFSYNLNPNRGASDVYLQFYSKGFNQYGSEIEIKDLKVIKIFTPKVFLARNLSLTTPPLPHVSFQQINQTKYLVHVQNANGPYILNFGQSYDQGWRASILAQPLTENNHFKTNGYANGWLVDKKGSYEIIIEYWPQRLVYLGFIVSLVTLFSFLLLLIFKLWRGLK